MLSRSSFVAVAILLLSGCSVTPLYNDVSSHKEGDQGTVIVDTIANRDGQRLRSYLKAYLRDLQFTKEPLRLTVTLTLEEKPFALDTDGYARRLLSTYKARAILRNRDNNAIIMDRIVTASTVYNIARAQGEVMLSLYGRNNLALLKELAHRIIENIRMSLKK